MKREPAAGGTRERILEAAVHLFAEKGYHGTSVRELAREVGIKESSLYNHYAGKEAVLDAILEYQMEGFRRALGCLEELEENAPEFTDPVELWLAGAGAFIALLPPLTEPIGLILHNEMNLDRRCRQFALNELFRVRKELTENLLRKLHEQGMIRVADFRKTAAQYVHMLHGLEMESRLRRLEGEPEEVLQQELREQIACFIERLK